MLLLNIEIDANIVGILWEEVVIQTRVGDEMLAAQKRMRSDRHY
jgi:hypothetical protein